MNFTATFLVVCLAAVVSADNLLELASKIGVKSLVKLVTDAGLANMLAVEGPFTVFAPSDDAIAQVPRAVLERLMSDKDFVADVLKYHMTSGYMYLSQLTNEMLIPSLYLSQAKAVPIRINTYRSGSIKTADGCYLTNYLSNQNATNGVIHIVEKVMYPFPLNNIPGQLNTEKGRFSNLISAIARTDLSSTLAGGPFTLFAPTDAAFLKLPYRYIDNLNTTALTDVLTYHLLPGSQWKAGLKLLDREMVKTVEGKNITITENYITDLIMVNGARIQEADMAVTNGVIHVIDTVLLPAMLN